ncbi:UNVERIFIED_CONTAM: Retrovirus-related Pol polyprotein from transposon RE2 [Sesamum radiatum]|uniref:Retrovirus-related Pol polyprotein from transposon RE2 n=1 Tax=Sesamum radiatum TaxID=300843 RepID=A0AAW2NA85_SESRA
MLPPEGYMIQTPGQITSTCFVALLVYVDDLLSKYLTDILRDVHMLDSRPAPTPLPPGLKLSADDGTLLFDPGPFRRLLSQFLQHPRSSHWDAALHVRYLKGTSSLGLFFSAQNSLQPTVYTDASWASCPESRRSITGFCIFLGSSLVSWKTKKQSTVSRSSAEAEYRSMELLFVNFYGCPISYMLCTSFLHSCSILVRQPGRHSHHRNPVFHERTKHLDIDCHLVRDQFKSGFIKPSHVPGRDQLANLFTKTPPPVFLLFLSSWAWPPKLHPEGGCRSSKVAAESQK